MKDEEKEKKVKSRRDGDGSVIGLLDTVSGSDESDDRLTRGGYGY